MLGGNILLLVNYFLILKSHDFTKKKTTSEKQNYNFFFHSTLGLIYNIFLLSAKGDLKMAHLAFAYKEHWND